MTSYSYSYSYENIEIHEFGETVKTVRTNDFVYRLPIFYAGYSFWTPAQFVNFYYVPLKYQVAYSSILAVALNLYFCYKMFE